MAILKNIESGDDMPEDFWTDDDVEVGVGFFVGAGIPKGERSKVFVECECCGCWHRADFRGDCREDSERFPEPPDDAADLVSLEEQMEEEEDRR